MNDIKIAIVDDEALSLKIMEILVRKEFPELQICSFATNGIEAKKIIETEHPDIVIMDIRMPGLTGLELMKLLKEKTHIHFIISTAYSNFDYIHSALELKADGYLLKPTRREEAIEVIQKVIDEINAERKLEEQNRNAQLALHAVNPALEWKIINSICSRQSDRQQINVWKAINNFKETHASIIVFTLTHHDCVINSKVIIETIRDIMKTIGHCMVGADHHNNFVLLAFYPSKLKAESEYSWISEICEILSQHLLRQNNIHMEWIIGDAGDTFEQYCNSYQKCMTKITKKEKIIIPDSRDAQGYSRAAKRYIHQHFNENISLDQCADAIGISFYYLSHIFREANGINFVDYLSSVRIEAAKRMCRDKSIPIKEIGTRCGYVNTCYFYKVFKKATGMTVGDYRKTVISEKEK